MKRIGTILLLIVCYVMTGSSMAKVDPYSFYPSKRYKPKGEFFRPAKKLIDRNPRTPLVIKDKNGNVMYTTSDGKIMVEVDTHGNKTFLLKGRKTHKMDSKGKLTRQWKREAGSNIVVVKNEFDEKIGLEEYGLGGKIIAGYDADGNRIISYKYKKYGKSVDWVIDELTQSRVKYGDDGKPLYEVDCEGNKLAVYAYDEEGKLKYKDDIYGNRTFYDEKGNMLKTVAKEGYVLATYYYKKDKEGYLTLKTVRDEITGDVTIYEDGRPQEVRNNRDAVIKDYKWCGTTLIYTENIKTGEITWYKNGKPTYITHEGYLIKEWMYYQGKLLGIWNEKSRSFQFYSHGKEEMELYLGEKPEMNKLIQMFETYGIEI